MKIVSRNYENRKRQLLTGRETNKTFQVLFTQRLKLIEYIIHTIYLSIHGKMRDKKKAILTNFIQYDNTLGHFYSAHYGEI